MEKVELRVILDEIGWSQAELSRRVGVSDATITRWVKIPGPVEAYVRLVRRLIGGVKILLVCLLFLGCVSVYEVSEYREASCNSYFPVRSDSHSSNADDYFPVEGY